MATKLDPPTGASEPTADQTVVSSEAEPTSIPAATNEVTNTATTASVADNPPATVPTTTESTDRKASDVRATPSTPAKDDGVNPPDFEGSVDSNNELPSAETMRKIEDYVVLDRDGKSHTFKSLYTGNHVARRVLIIFVRHFFCGVS